MKNLQEIEQESSIKEGDTSTTITSGDIFILGEHVLLCGDSTESELVEKVLKGKQIQIILTDVPYWIDYVASKEWFNESTMNHEDIANDGFQTDEEYASFTEKWMRIVIPFLAPKNASYIFNSDKMIFALREGMKRAGWKFSQLIIWIKNSAIIWRLDYLPQHELIAYGWHGKHAFYSGKSKSVLAFAKTRKNTIHPTMKPIPLLRELILNSSTRSSFVYDPFGWSGSTLIACEQTGRKCVMVEQDTVYIERIIKRWEKLTGKIAIKFNKASDSESSATSLN
jgi:DNA modification methylase